MRDEQGMPSGHERFDELCALSTSGALTAGEEASLQEHLRSCAECREACQQYLVLARDGMPMLAAGYMSQREGAANEGAPDRLQRSERTAGTEASPGFLRNTSLLRFTQRLAVHVAAGALAAGAVIAVAVNAYHYGRRNEVVAIESKEVAQGRLEKLAAEKRAVDEVLKARDQQLSQLAAESIQAQADIERLRSDLRTMEERSNALAAARRSAEEQFRAVLQQRDALSTERDASALQLRNAEHAHEAVRAELASLRADRDKAASKAVSLESHMQDLAAVNRDQERRLKDSEQYLAANRDIRELMGARKLYIADVYDVDSSSRTRKPFGRVFYTQGKSLIFYAFDLDRQPGLKNARASVFQAWGLRNTEEGPPFNLGILYMDNETNRRWVLRSDDPRKLAEINAVFVTVEPNGGSRKPTSKPFLYALLRREANHP